MITSLTISDIEPTLAERLRRRAIQHGLSVEAEAHRILKHALDTDVAGPTPDIDLYTRIHDRFASLDGGDIVVAPRAATREPPRFD